MRRVINIDKDWKFSKRLLLYRARFRAIGRALICHTLSMAMTDRTAVTIIIVARDILQRAWLKRYA